MTISPVPSEHPKDQMPRFRGRLARTMALTLVAVSIIPLLVMGASAYLRARTLLLNQISSQIQTAMESQMTQVQGSVRAKAVRLNRIVRMKEFTDALEKTLPISRGTLQFKLERSNVINTFEKVNRQEGTPVFNNFFFVRADGVIHIASNPAWEGVDISDSPFYSLIQATHDETLAVYNFEPLYPNQMVFITIEQYNQFGSVKGRSGALIGVSEQKNVQSILNNLTTFNRSFRPYFVTADNHFIGINPYRKELAAFEPSLQQSDLLSATKLQAGQGNELIGFVNPENEAVIAVGRWADFLNAGLVVEIPEERVFQQLNSLAPFMAILVVLTIMGMAGVVWVGTNQLVKPLLNMVETTRHFAEGNFEERLTSRRNDELGLLAWSFNHMADELSALYQSLEARVEERTRQIRTAAEVAQDITSSIDIDDLLNKTVKLIVERFGFYHAGIFLLDRAGKTATLRAVYGPAADAMRERGHSLAVGSQSIIGWVTENNKPRVASDVGEDPMHFKNPLLPNTRAEVGIPITAGNLVLGALDVQSTEPEAFDDATIVTLQTLANQIASAIQNIELAASTEVNLNELERLYRASRQIAEAPTEESVIQSTGQVLSDAPYISAVLAASGKSFEPVSVTDAAGIQMLEFSTRKLDISPADLAPYLASGLTLVDLSKPSNLPTTLIRYARQLGCQSAAFLPITVNEQLTALIILGSAQKGALTAANVQPYANLAGFVATSLEKINASRSIERRLAEMEALAAISQSVMVASDLQTFYTTLHEQVRQTVGDYNFMIALYDKQKETIYVPYLYEDGQITNLEPFPLGEGLTSILIRTKQPLMLVENVEKRLAALGARTIGQPAKSWLGTPLLARGEAIGALILQDNKRENQFDENDLRFLNAVAAQVAGAVHNIRLLEESRMQSVQLQTAAEIARDISRSLNLDELLHTAINLIRDRFGFYHAAVFLIDPSGEYAIVREATGDAGAQMKRMGHKLGVGSKSVIGYVTGRGEPLVVNDTTKDVTYLANPLLPDTRSEAAIPLKVGERILGALDVQSNLPYAFSEGNLQTLQILADQLAVAVINTELFAETQEHLSQHRLLHHVTTAAASGTTLEEALYSAAQGLQVTLGGDRVAIMLVNREKQTLEIKASIGYSEEDIANVNVPIGTGITGWVAAHRKPLRVDNIENDPRYIQVSPNTRSELAVPLLYRNEVLGVLNVESERVNAYTENDEELLGTLGGSLAAIIANARLLDQIRRQAERERLIYEITSKIRRSTDMQTILATTAGELARVVNARRMQVRLGVGNEPSEKANGKDSDVERR